MASEKRIERLLQRSKRCVLPLNDSEILVGLKGVEPLRIYALVSKTNVATIYTTGLWCWLNELNAH